jgi:PhoH-like ATPase
MKKTYVLDTNVFLTNAKSIFSFNNNDIVIPLKVLEEIDKHKKRQDGVGLNARATIRILDDLREKGNLHKGVRLGKGKGILSVKMYDPDLMPLGLDETNADNQIVTTALTEKRDDPKRKVIVTSRDINMRIKCDALEMPSEDYIEDQVVSDIQELYDGFKAHLVDDPIIDRFYAGEDIMATAIEGKFYPNQYVMLLSNSDPKHAALAKFVNNQTPLQKIDEYKNKGIWGLRARNKEQAFALDMLMNKDIPIISMIGPAGCGKTLLAIAAGLDQVLDQNRYKKLVVSRPIQPVGRDIGFLPGTLEEKMGPWIMPVQDNLEFLMGDKKDTMSLLMEQGTIEIEALTYIRGRSISNAYVIIDEAQNLTVHELKTIVTRIGENSKIILTGDIEQIDNTYLDAISNGLSYAIEKFKEHEISGHIILKKGERSKVATLASKIL